MLSVRSGIPTVADDFIGPTIGRSGYRTTAEFSDAAFARYQQFYDQADVIAQARVAAGRWPNDPTIIGARMDAIARSRLLASEEIAEVVCSPKLVPPDMRVSNRPLWPEGTLDERQEAHARADHRQAA